MSQNQHYVPRFYLRHFSKDQKNLLIYILNQEKFISGPLDKQCAKINFYSKNPKVEEVFSQYEGKISRTMVDIIKNGSFVNLSKEDYFELLAFILWQSGRTRSAASTVTEGVNRMFDYIKPAMINDEKFVKANISPESIKNAKLVHPHPALFSSLCGLTAAQLLVDLQMVLMVNNTEVEFITSDAPVVFFNSFFNQTSLGGVIGIASKGLQIFYPISPRYMIFLYDPSYYAINFDKKFTFKIKKPKDVRRINVLQILNCENSIYYTNQSTEKDIKLQHSQIQHKRLDKKTDFRPVSRIREGGKIRELMQFYHKTLRYDLTKLSFLQTNEHADSLPGVRNEEMLEINDQYVNEKFKWSKY